MDYKSDPRCNQKETISVEDMIRLTRIALIAFVSGVGATPAAAHPHVWVTVRDTVVIEHDQILGVQHEWTFDDMYTTMAIEGLDKNKDGKYDRGELQELAQTNIDGLKDFENFTYAQVAGMKVLFGQPKDYWLDHTNNVLTLHFYLPLAQPLAVSTPHFKVTVTDPSYFIGFEFDKETPFKVSKGAPTSCKTAIVQEQDDQKDLNQAFSTQMSPMGSGGNNTFEVTCAK